VSILRQVPLFLLMGGVQLVLDSAVTIGLSRAGLALGLANVIGRVCGAMLGFWLNGRFTFGGPGSRLGRAALVRFLAAWLLLTAASTLGLAAIASNLSLQAAWIAKPVVEAALAVASFFISRHWVYRAA
jgi:putative flippase GtrA